MAELKVAAANSKAAVRRKQTAKGALSKNTSPKPGPMHLVERRYIFLLRNQVPCAILLWKYAQSAD